MKNVLSAVVILGVGVGVGVSGCGEAATTATATGGKSGSGGVPGTGSGGRAETGGASVPSTGGATSTGGTSGSGGVTMPASGGSGDSGGAAGPGGRGGAGVSGTGASPGSGGSTTNPDRAPICTYANGLNIAWVNFGSDIPNPNINTFNTIFKNTFNAGGRIIRWWLHTNGTVSPGYDSSGKAQKLPQSHIDGIKAVLNAAHSAGVAINLSLWSFDMLQANAGNAHTNNQALLENDINRQAYVDNYLTPLVTALKGTPGLYSYEIFNEPEGMGPKGWATYRTTEAAIQKCVNWFSAAIHAADPKVLVTNAAVTFDYCSNVSGKTNYYSDTALRNVGGKQGGTLDFYEVHYYTSNGISNSAFKHPASYWGLTDKKLLMGEFAAQTTDDIAKDDLHTYLYTNGYSGSWSWSYDADWPWPAMQKAMQNVESAHKTEVDSCPP